MSKLGLGFAFGVAEKREIKTLRFAGERGEGTKVSTIGGNGLNC